VDDPHVAGPTPSIGAFPLPREQVVARLAAGVPMLHEQPLQLDVQFARTALGALLAAESTPPGLTLAHALERGILDAQQVVDEAFVQHPAHVRELADAAHVDADLLSALSERAVAPIRRAYATQLAPLLARGLDSVAWTRGYCPVCGAWASRTDVSATSLWCDACGTGWPRSPRICPFCGRVDSATPRADPAIRGCADCLTYLLTGPATAADTARAAALGLHRPHQPGYVIELAVPDADWLAELA
jgi:hypothetical protein